MLDHFVLLNPVAGYSIFIDIDVTEFMDNSKALIKLTMHNFVDKSKAFDNGF